MVYYKIIVLMMFIFMKGITKLFEMLKEDELFAFFVLFP